VGCVGVQKGAEGGAAQIKKKGKGDRNGNNEHGLKKAVTGREKNNTSRAHAAAEEKKNTPSQRGQITSSKRGPRTK